ncbi:hypothetical protein C8F04DRAFT_1117433 [Mycena alexandri]|uniref:Uncharacterized protein n=1 Tax=Mycena alexandri TaxID=1745969 RepID=A0AAD6SK44_9AGAR|nr:hypothetical protein C8F04DRAFT_1117433 [Mycena alexandri]
MDGGSLSSQYLSMYVSYLLKCVQGFKSEGLTLPYAISIQNQLQNSQTSYPTARIESNEDLARAPDSTQAQAFASSREFARAESWIEREFARARAWLESLERR